MNSIVKLRTAQFGSVNWVGFVEVINALIITLIMEIKVVKNRARLLYLSNRCCLSGFWILPLPTTKSMYARRNWKRSEAQTRIRDAIQIPSRCFWAISVRSCMALLAGNKKRKVSLTEREFPIYWSKQIQVNHCLKERVPWNFERALDDFSYRSSFWLHNDCNYNHIPSKSEQKRNRIHIWSDLTSMLLSIDTVSLSLIE